MSSADARSEPRSRQACESCRRKKAKCTAERPICSVCQRSHQECVYLPRDQTRRNPRIDKSSRKISKDRIQGIEAQISHLYTILQSVPGADLNTSPDAHELTRDAESISVNVNEQSMLDPSHEEIAQAVHVYSTKIHMQPLPLFDTQRLLNYLVQSSPFLRWSFLALCLNFTSLSRRSGHESAATQSYSMSGNKAVMELACEGTATLEVLQALCLLALDDMIVGKPARAWMTIGIAARLQAYRNLSSQSILNDATDKEDISRCYWSIFILERAFSCQLKAFGNHGNPPSYPHGVPWPGPSQLQPFDVRHSDHAVVNQQVTDPGILTHCIELVSLWGDVTSYLHELRAGKVENPWQPNSTNAQLVLEFHELEIRLSPKFFLKNAHLSDRSTTDFLKHREYWTLWAFTQIAFHSISLVLNHPFIHLISTKDTSRAPKPRLFLQRTVDQALYHSGWVVHLLRLFGSFPFELNDPLMGHLVAATATVLWFFQFVRDSKISKDAKAGLDKCQDFLTRMSHNWPHIAQKLKILQHLLAKVQDGRQEGEHTSTTITFQPSMIWALLDSTISQMESEDLVYPIPISGSEHGEDASIQLTVNFVPPLVDGQEHGLSASNNTPGLDSFSYGNVGFDPMLHGFFSQFIPEDDTTWLSSMPAQSSTDGPMF